MKKIEIFYIHKKDGRLKPHWWHGAYKYCKIFDRTWWRISIQTKDEKINCYTLIYCKADMYC
jgi:hypothetical protein